MSKSIFYRQCQLRKDNKDGSYMEQVSYIPEPYCQEGKVVKLRDSEGVWDNGWVVISASQHRHEDNELPDIHKAIRGHRQATGDSSKK